MNEGSQSDNIARINLKRVAQKQRSDGYTAQEILRQGLLMKTNQIWAFAIVRIVREFMTQQSKTYLSLIICEKYSQSIN